MPTTTRSQASFRVIFMIGAVGLFAAPGLTDEPVRRPRLSPGIVLNERAPELIPEAQRFVDQSVAAHFGMPDKPQFWRTNLPQPKGAPAASPEILRRGQQLFLTKCANCHGKLGMGDGPRAEKLDPPVFTLRRPNFKWKSTKRPGLPTRFDLLETVRLGIPGTAMPSFKSLSNADRGAIVDYFRWLVLRRGFESAAEFTIAVDDIFIRNGSAPHEIAPANLQELEEVAALELRPIEEQIIRVVREKLLDSEGLVVQVPDQVPELTPEMVRLGKQAFVRARCAACHGETGRGDGPETRRVRTLANGKVLKGLADRTGNIHQPRDFTKGVFWGGSDTRTLFTRIRTGIDAMPSFDKRLLSDNDVWNIIAYVKSLRNEKVDSALLVHRNHPRREVTGDSPAPIATDPKTWGKIHGRVSVSGPIPSLPPLIRKGHTRVKDSAYCAKQGVPDESLIVGEKGGLANAFVYLVSVKPNSFPAQQPPLPLVIASKNCQFVPHASIVRTGQTVVCKNSGEVPENFRFSPRRNRALSVLVRPGGTLNLKSAFKRPESEPFSIQCDYHSWMKAYVLVVDHPFAAVTKPDGTFEFKVPAGEHKLAIWHEREGGGFIVEKKTIRVRENATTEFNQSVLGDDLR